MLYSHNHNIDLRTSMNERTNFFIKIYISHTSFSKGLMFLWCVRDEWRQGQTAILTQLLLLTIARCVIFENPLSTSSASWLGLFNRGLLRATALSLHSGPHSGLPVPNSLNCRRHLPIFFHNAQLLPLLPLIYTDASLIDGSVKGQYITCSFTFCTTNVFDFFHDVIANKLVKHMLPNKTTLHVHLCSFQITCSVKQCTSY